MKDCRDCINCDFIWGFMCTCHYSYDEVREDGSKWHVQSGSDQNRKKANKCEHYTPQPYDRDKVFILQELKIEVL